jgi:arginase family enzyme
MHRDAVQGGHLVVNIADVRAEGIDRAIGRALDHLRHCDAIVVDCDIDVIDRSQMPGAPGARPGGMAVADFFIAVRSLAAEPSVRLIDLTEWDPPLDPTDLSALTAARWAANASRDSKPVEKFTDGLSPSPAASSLCGAARGRRHAFR